MSLYNMLFGKDINSDMLLKVLGINMNDIPRYRDCFLSGDGEICIHTRTGGGNREYYDTENKKLASHPNYLYDSDDEFDCTYANFFYSFPSEYEKDLKALELENEAYTPSEKWKLLSGCMGIPEEENK